MVLSKNFSMKSVHVVGALIIYFVVWPFDHSNFLGMSACTRSEKSKLRTYLKCYLQKLARKFVILHSQATPPQKKFNGNSGAFANVSSLALLFSRIWSNRSAL